MTHSNFSFSSFKLLTLIAIIASCSAGMINIDGVCYIRKIPITLECHEQYFGLKVKCDVDVSQIPSTNLNAKCKEKKSEVEFDFDPLEVLGLHVIGNLPENVTNYSNLIALTIEENRMKEIKELQSFKQLITFKCLSCSIEFLTKSTFAFNPNLKSVELLSNKLVYIEAGSFRRIDKVELSGRCESINGINCDGTALVEFIKEKEKNCEEFYVKIIFGLCIAFSVIVGCLTVKELCQGNGDEVY